MKYTDEQREAIILNLFTYDEEEIKENIASGEIEDVIDEAVHSKKSREASDLVNRDIDDRLAYLSGVSEIKSNLNCLYQDFSMLLEGTWEPEDESISASIEMVERLAKNLGIDLHSLG